MDFSIYCIFYYLLAKKLLKCDSKLCKALAFCMANELESYILKSKKPDRLKYIQKNFFHDRYILAGSIRFLDKEFTIVKNKKKLYPIYKGYLISDFEFNRYMKSSYLDFAKKLSNLLSKTPKEQFSSYKDFLNFENKIFEILDKTQKIN